MRKTSDFMKIMILSPSLKVGGGAEKFSANLGNEFSKNSHEVYHLTFCDESPKYEFKGKYSSLCDDNGKKGFLKGLLSLVVKSNKITKFCRDNDISVVISVGENQNYHAVLSKILFRNRVKMIITQHLSPERYLNDKISYFLIKFLYPRADEVICVSKGIENSLKKLFNLKNTKTIYNSLDFSIIKKNAEVKLPTEYHDIFKSKFVFINVGRLSTQKGQWFLIRSFRRVVNQFEDARLCIIGDGKLKKDYTELIKYLNLEKNIFLLGNQSNVFPFLVNSQVFVLSSLWEGFPMVLIEALSMDLPIISVDCQTGPRECLCPELDIDTEIDYPYYGTNGILSENFNQEDFNTNGKDFLTKPEIMLSDIMIKFLKNDKLIKQYSKDFSSVILDNKETSIIWETLISK